MYTKQLESLRIKLNNDTITTKELQSFRVLKGLSNTNRTDNIYCVFYTIKTVSNRVVSRPTYKIWLYNFNDLCIFCLNQIKQLKNRADKLTITSYTLPQYKAIEAKGQEYTKSGSLY